MNIVVAYGVRISAYLTSGESGRKAKTGFFAKAIKVE